MNGPAGWESETIRCNLGVKYLCLCWEQYKMIQCTMGILRYCVPVSGWNSPPLSGRITIGIFIKTEPPLISAPVHDEGILPFCKETLEEFNFYGSSFNNA